MCFLKGLKGTGLGVRILTVAFASSITSSERLNIHLSFLVCKMGFLFLP
jgi:putative effector of murein hydrolase LrgA (UPF0299 family)